MVADCASLSESLLESELFGHVRGAFTGAVKDRKGLAETARGGTLFLDEISTISPQVQGSLLRLIQEHEVRPVGSDKPVAVDVRLIAATNKELQELVEDGSYREDLFYRLSVFTIRLPPLRERPEEIPLLAHHFAQRFGEEFGKPIDAITPRAMARAGDPRVAGQRPGAGARHRAGGAPGRRAHHRRGLDPHRGRAPQRHVERRARRRRRPGDPQAGAPRGRGGSHRAALRAQGTAQAPSGT